jgi:hypothetical protein
MTLDETFERGPVDASVHIECVTLTDECFLVEQSLGRLTRSTMAIDCLEQEGYPLRMTLTNSPIVKDGRRPTMSMWLRCPTGCDVTHRSRDGTVTLMEIAPENPQRPYGSVVRVESSAKALHDGKQDTMMVRRHVAEGK